MIQATGAQIIVKLLENQGVKTAAGIPGGSILPLYDELLKSSIEHILVRQEQAGGFFAQGMARTKGETAVCFATSGPGVMNLLTAIADARVDSIPLVAITGQVNSHLLGTDAFQEADTFGLSFPITKHSIFIHSPEELLSAIPLAFEIAASGRPGPVLIDIPRDVQTKQAFFEQWPLPGRKVKKAVRFRTEGDVLVKKIEQSVDIISQAQRPVFYLGGGCNSPEASRGVLSFLEYLPIPVVTSLMGLGAIPSAHPCFTGMVGMHGSRAANKAMYESDVVIACGVRFDDRATGLTKQFCPQARIIHIDIDAAEVNKILSSTIGIIGDVESVIPLLGGVCRERKIVLPETAEGWIKELKNTESGYPEDIAAAKIISSLPLTAEKAGYKPEDLIIVTDVGQHQMWTAQYFPFAYPRQFLTSGSLGTMGFGLPTAIGAAFANPGKRVVCITGDGSIQMNIQELATLAELNLDVTVLLFDNEVLGMVRQQQEMLFNKAYSASIFKRPPDLVSVAQAYGIISGDFDENGENILFPKSNKGPRFVRICINKDDNVYPFVPAGKKNIDSITK
ncbi:MAG TPA: biosynthetic-type acetolactate synthase large subunit [Treponemataceae bacterium]|nr:biosynthetic-type acetolactate synthase large subunit [Treponemataceae bacterium]HQL04188.1 biosynthetic-type acetolactate synthase large subunit [Treponemataceae bacterium]